MMQPHSVVKKTSSCQNLGSILILWMDVQLKECHQVNLFLLQDQFSCQIVHRLGDGGETIRGKSWGQQDPAKECIKGQPTCGNCSSQRETLNPGGGGTSLSLLWNRYCSTLAKNGWLLCWKQHTCQAVGLRRGCTVNGPNTSAIIAAAFRDFRSLCSPERGWEQLSLCLSINLGAVCFSFGLFVLFECFWRNRQILLSIAFFSKSSNGETLKIKALRILSSGLRCHCAHFN